MAAGERGLILPVGLLAMATAGARPAGVARINDLDRDAREPRLVLHERAQLAEGPAAHLRPLCSPEPGPRADARQVLQGNAARGVFGDRNEGEHLLDSSLGSGDHGQDDTRGVGTDSDGAGAS